MDTFYDLASAAEKALSEAQFTYYDGPRTKGRGISATEWIRRQKYGGYAKEIAILRDPATPEQSENQRHFITHFTPALTNGNRKPEDIVISGDFIVCVFPKVGRTRAREIRDAVVKYPRIRRAWVDAEDDGVVALVYRPKSDTVELSAMKREFLLDLSVEAVFRESHEITPASHDPDLASNVIESILDVPSERDMPMILIPANNVSKPLPCAPDVERAFCGLLIMNPAILEPSGLIPSDFTDEMCKELVTLIPIMQQDGIQIDLVNLGARLHTNGKLEKLGGPENLASILSSCGVADHRSDYVETIKERSRRRQLLMLSQRMAQSALDEKRPLEVALGPVSEKLATLMIGRPGRKRFTLSDIDARRINPEAPPVRPVPVLTLQGQQICTAGNITVLGAQVKSGKSAAIGAVLAALLAAEEGNESVDTLGFSAIASEGLAVVHFDTEQSPYDSFSLIKRALHRSGVKCLPPNFRAYALCDVPTTDRRRLLSAELERALSACGGVRLVTIDGIADLLRDPNDADESFDLVEEIFQLAVKYSCPIICVLHENPGVNGATGKTRGHLGSQLERKAESNLRLIKKGDVSTLFSEKCRSANLPESQGVKFSWSDEHQMHITNTEMENVTASHKSDGERSACEAAFGNIGEPLTYAALKSRIVEHTKVSTRTAERKIPKWESLGLISKSGSSYIKTA